MHSILKATCLLLAILLGLWGLWLSGSLSIENLGYKKAIDNLKVGVVLPLSSPMGGEYSREILNGLKHALSSSAWSHLPVTSYDTEQEYAAKIELVVRDHKGDYEVGKQMVEELCQIERVNVIIGGLSSLESLSYASITAKHGRIFVSLLPRWIDGFSEFPRAISFASSYSWQTKLVAHYLTTQKRVAPEDIVIVTEDLQSSENTAALKTMHSLFIQPPALTTSPLKVITLKHPQHILAFPNATPPKTPLDPHANTNPFRSAQKIWSDIGSTILLSKAKAVFIMLTAKDSLALLKTLERKGFRNIAIGLDHWEHPSMQQKHSWRMEVGYISSAHEDVFLSTFVDTYTKHLGKPPSLLSALGYDVMMWMISLYSKAQTARIPPIMKQLLSGPINARASFSGTYKLEDLHNRYLAREMIYIPLSKGNKRIIGHTLIHP